MTLALPVLLNPAGRRPKKEKKVAKKTGRRAGGKKKAKKKASRKKSSSKRKIYCPPGYKPRKKRRKKSSVGATVAKKRSKKSGAARKKRKKTSVRTRGESKKASIGYRRSARRAARYEATAATAKRKRRPAPPKTYMLKMHAGHSLTPAARKKLYDAGMLSKAGVANPRRKRRKARRNPINRPYVGGSPKAKDRRRGRRVKKNPGRRIRRNPFGLNSMSGLFTRGASTALLANGAQIAAGLGVAAMVPSGIEYAAGQIGLGQYVRNDGVPGLVLSFVTIGVHYQIGGVIESTRLPGTQGARRNLTAAAAALFVVRAIRDFAPQIADALTLPSIRRPVYGAAPAAAPAAVMAPIAVPASGAAGMGRYHGDYGMMGMGSMGAATSPEALVAGESFARSVNQFSGMGMSGMGDFVELRGMGDFVELRGMGGMGFTDPAYNTGGRLHQFEHYPGQYGRPAFPQNMSLAGMGQGGSSDHYRIPMSQIRAPGQLIGMGDFFQTLPGSELALTDYQPAMENF